MELFCNTNHNSNICSATDFGLKMVSVWKVCICILCFFYLFLWCQGRKQACSSISVLGGQPWSQSQPGPGTVIMVLIVLCVCVLVGIFVFIWIIRTSSLHEYFTLLYISVSSNCFFRKWLSESSKVRMHMHLLAICLALILKGPFLFLWGAVRIIKQLKDR